MAHQPRILLSEKVRVNGTAVVVAAIAFLSTLSRGGSRQVPWCSTALAPNAIEIKTAASYHLCVFMLIIVESQSSVPNFLHVYSLYAQVLSPMGLNPGIYDELPECQLSRRDVCHSRIQRMRRV